MFETVAVTDEVVVASNMVGGAMTCGFVFFVVALDDESAATFEHLLTHRVDIRTSHVAATSHHHFVVALVATAAVVVAYKQIVIVAMAEDERSLDCVLASELGRGVWSGVRVVWLVTTGYCYGMFTLGNVER